MLSNSGTVFSKLNWCFPSQGLMRPFVIIVIKIFNILQEEVDTLVSDRLSAGSYSYDWDASKFAGGVYLYRLKAGNYVETKKMILLK